MLNKLCIFLFLGLIVKTKCFFARNKMLEKCLQNVKKNLKRFDTQGPPWSNTQKLNLSKQRYF